jgi:hypothetical protein
MLYLILILPQPVRITFTFMILILWGIAAGYKDWIIDKRKRQIKGFEEN